MCNHKICNGNKKVRGVFAVVLTSIDNIPKVYLGREIKNGQYNVLGGKPNPSDKNCLYTTAIREIYEEGKLTIDMRNFMDYHVIIRDTPIFYVHIKKIDVAAAKREIDTAINDNYLPHLREMDDVKLMDFDDDMSEFARECISKIPN